jgi:hypothetical protein
VEVFSGNSADSVIKYGPNDFNFVEISTNLSQHLQNPHLAPLKGCQMVIFSEQNGL